MVKRYGVSKGFSKQSSPERAPRKENPKSKNNHTPKHPTLRANPFPKVTDLICRLPLSALFYQLEAVHLGDLLRIWVRAGASPPSPPRDFQGPAGCSWMPRELRHSSPDAKTHSPCETIRGPRRLMQKRQLFPGLQPASPGRVALPRQIRGSERFRCRVPEYGPDSLLASPWHDVFTVT